MDTKQVEKKAKEIFGEEGLYCAESVLTAVADQAGVQSSLIPRIATGFCSGVSRTGGMCGAVSGGIMALGILFGRDDGKQACDLVYKKVQQFVLAFEKEHGAVDCFELTGCDLSREEGRQVFREKGVMETCRRFTGTAAGLVATLASGEENSAGSNRQNRSLSHRKNAGACD